LTRRTLVAVVASLALLIATGIAAYSWGQENVKSTLEELSTPHETLIIQRPSHVPPGYVPYYVTKEDAAKGMGSTGTAKDEGQIAWFREGFGPDDDPTATIPDQSAKE
jgi:hypothetical protein